MPGLLDFLSDQAERRQIGANALASTTRGIVAGGLGAPVDMLHTLANLGIAGAGYLGNKVGLIPNDKLPELLPEPVGGSEWIGRQMQRAGLLSGYRNPNAELIAGGLLAPAATVAVQARAPKIARGLLQMGDNISAPSSRNITQRGMIDIEFRKSKELGKTARLEDGKLVVEWPGFGSSPASLADFARAEASKIAAPKYDHFFRFTNNKDEVSLALAKALRPSKNHAENFVEAGLSVADGPHYSTAGYKYGYPVRGRVIGTGSDGEPLLDVLTLEPLAPRALPSSEIAKAGWAAQAEQLQRLGLPRDWLDNRYRFLNDPYTFKPN